MRTFPLGLALTVGSFNLNPTSSFFTLGLLSNSESEEMTITSKVVCCRATGLFYLNLAGPLISPSPCGNVVFLAVVLTTGLIPSLALSKSRSDLGQLDQLVDSPDESPPLLA